MGPIKSSGLQLKTMLKKTGRSLKTFEGVEKLDVLHAITDQIKDRVRLGRRMQLTLPELNAFLQVEGLVAGADAKGTIKLLLELRQIQLARLADYVACRSTSEYSDGNGDRTFSLALMAIPTEAVHDCFSNALMTITTETTHDCFSVDTLPKSVHGDIGKDAAHTVSGQVVTRKRQRELINYTDASNEGAVRPTSVQRLGVVSRCSEGVMKEMTPDQEVARVMGSNDVFAGGCVEAALSPGLKLLLAEQDVSQACTFETVHALLDSFETVHALEGLALGSEQHQDHDQESCDFSLHQAKAAREVDRILATEEVQDILGPGTSKEQRQQFQRIASLLHPDKSYIDASDTRANMALRLALVARKRAGEDIKLSELIASTRQSQGS